MIFLPAIIWMLFGVAGFLFFAIMGMRGEKYNEFKFKTQGFCLSNFIFFCVFGVIGFILAICMYEENKGFSFTKLLYKIANIGIKKDENEGE